MAAKKKNKEETVQEELEDIKRLLMLLMMKLGTQSEEIALALGVSKATVTGVIPMKKLKGKYSFISD